MLGFKKIIGEDLFQLAILLSILRVDLDTYLDLNRNNYGLEDREIVLGSSSAYTQFHIHDLHNRLNGYNVHPKNVESMILNQQSLFYELNLLGRYQNSYEINSEVTTYLLSEQERGENSSEEVPVSQNNVQTRNDTPEAAISSPVPASTSTVVAEEEVSSSSLADYSLGANLTKEDMDLIDVLLRQDIDLGVTREVFDAQLRREVEKSAEGKEETTANPNPDDVRPTNPWAGLNYTIDSETGEHVIQDEEDEVNIPNEIVSSPIDATLTEDELLSSLTVDFENIPLDEALQLAEFDKDDTREDIENNKSPESGVGGEDDDFLSSAVDLAASSPFLDGTDESLSAELEQLEEMIQATQLHMHSHGRQFQARMPYLRTVSMEQRWQDLANILSLPLSSETDIHNPLAMVHAPAHNYTATANTSFGGIDNRSAILLHNASLAPPMGDINSNVSSYHSDMEISSVAAAVATSLSTLTNGSEPMGDGTSHGVGYGGDGGSLLYPHNHTEMNQTTDGFLSSILNDEDLQLMDMTMNEGSYNGTDRYMQNNQTITGMYPMRMENDDAMDTSSDSAVSSMGSSERVTSISEGVHGYCRNNGAHTDWIETASNSSHPEDHDRYYGGMDYSHHSSSLPNKYRPYEYTYTSRHHVTPTLNSQGNPPLERAVPPVAQKKYQLFGKRFPTDQALGGNIYHSNRNPTMVHQPDGIKYSDYPYDRNHQDRSGRPPFEMVEGATAIDPPEHKFSCSMEFARQHNGNPGQLGHIQHNHTYQLPSESLMSPQRPTVRDKQKKKMMTEEDYISRDEKRARALKIPLTTEEIVNLPMDEFNERISKFDLTESQLALIRDIRRRGKNKVAAQNCRKRKLDQILTLAEVVQDLHQNKDDILRERETLNLQKQRLQEKYSQLYRHVFQCMRDADGNSYPLRDYSLQQAANGSMVLVPSGNRMNNNIESDPTTGARAKKKDNGDKK